MDAGCIENGWVGAILLVIQFDFLFWLQSERLLGKFDLIEKDEESYEIGKWVVHGKVS